VNGRRTGNKPWKHIYGVDRKYTARIDRQRARSAEDAEDRAALEHDEAFYRNTPSTAFVLLEAPR
jgi:hypothetical protein